jgi:hypothetical protein
MSASSTQSPLYEDLARIHRIITNALESLKKHAAKMSTRDFSDNAYRIGLTNYLGSMSTFMHGHHMNEDELFFPTMKPAIPDVPYEALSEHHKQMAVHLDQLDGKTIPELEVGSKPGEAISSLAEWAENMLQLWIAHKDMEETHFSAEKLNAVFGVQEQHRLIKTFQAYGRRHSKPFSRIVPFILYSLPVGDARGLLPWFLTRLLVPYIWKPSWKSMTPFFAHPPR